jgi:superfamily II DNA helicase RecQ
MTSEELARTLGRIEGFTKATYEAVEKHLQDDLRVHTDLEDRMRIQERFRWVSMGAIILVATVGGWGLFA